MIFVKFCFAKSSKMSVSSVVYLSVHTVWWLIRHLRTCRSWPTPTLCRRRMVQVDSVGRCQQWQLTDDQPVPWQGLQLLTSLGLMLSLLLTQISGTQRHHTIAALRNGQQVLLSTRGRC